MKAWGWWRGSSRGSPSICARRKLDGVGAAVGVAVGDWL